MKFGVVVGKKGDVDTKPVLAYLMFKTIGDILPQHFDSSVRWEYFLQRTFPHMSLVHSWPKIMGNIYIAIFTQVSFLNKRYKSEVYYHFDFMLILGKNRPNAWTIKFYMFIFLMVSLFE